MKVFQEIHHFLILMDLLIIYIYLVKSESLGTEIFLNRELPSMHLQIY